ncbi:MAG: glycosyltransferase family 2 protein [Eubacteriales bacterium]|nr:glycosyltransferase family 2 protein [Eubacteriales bacterium]
MKLSFVIPCYRSEATIVPVLEEIRAKMEEKPSCDYEVITVNDCSPDHVLSVLTAYADTHDFLKIVDLTRNFGQHAAMMAGLSYASGEQIVFLDDDFQCPTDRLWELLAPLDEGYDVSLAQYKFEERKESFFRVLGSRLNDAMVSSLLDKPKDLRVTNFIAMQSFIAEEILRYKNPYPYIDGLILRATRRIACVPMEDRERLSGSSSYNLRKLISLFSNGFTAFSIKPLRVATFTGAFCSVIGFALGIVLIVQKLLDPANILPGYSSLMAVLLFIGGMIMIMLGICGEYIGRIYISLNSSPQYVIRGTYHLSGHPDERPDSPGKRSSEP